MADLLNQGVEFFKWVTGIDRGIQISNAASLQSPDSPDGRSAYNPSIARGATPESAATLPANSNFPFNVANVFFENENTTANTACSLSHTLPRDGSRLDSEWRLTLYYALLNSTKSVANQPQLWRDACSFDQLFEKDTLRVLPKTSASDTFIMMGTLKPPFYAPAELRRQWDAIKCDVVLKLSFPFLNPIFINPIKSISSSQKSGLDCEIELYELTSQLVQEKVSPNFVLGLAHWRCGSVTSVVSMLNPSIKEQLDDTARSIAIENDVAYNAAKQPVNFLLLERGRGASLADSYAKLSEKQLFSVVFQIIYTLNCMNRRLIRHADLHCGNVFIDVLNGAPTFGNYVLSDGTTYFHVPFLNCVAKIYDWDFGGVYASREYSKIADSVPPVSAAWPAPRKTIINSRAASQDCFTMSLCGINDKADVFTVLSNLYDLIVSRGQSENFPNLLAFIRRHIDARLLSLAKPRSNGFDSAGGFQYRLCKGVFDAPCPMNGFADAPPIANRGGFKRCNGAWEPDDCFVSTPARMLSDSVWQMWRRSTANRPNPSEKTDYVYGDWTNEKQRQFILNFFNQS